MTIPPRTPVVVGVGSVLQREDDPARALEPCALMAEALNQAADDAGSRALLENADKVAVPRGFWKYPDPARLVASALGADRAQTEVTEIGILQTTALARAAHDIAEGHCDIVLVAGGEARDRARRFATAGEPEELSSQPDGTAPDHVLRPSGDILSPCEIDAGLLMPVGAYAMMDNALRAHEGQDLDSHRDDVAQVWSGLSRAAVENADAWRPEYVAPKTIRDPSPQNPMMNFPYTRLHNSNWNVDQASGIVFCSAQTAERLEIPRERWVFPLSVAESNHMTFLTERRALHRSPGFAYAAERALSRTAVSAEEIAHFELYSCFPSAIRIQQREIGLDPAATATVTGGMPFAGGPLNNFVLQALAQMVRVLRDDPGSLGMVNAVSGLMTKQGVSLWSTEPRGPGFLYEDVSEATAAAIEPVVVDGELPSQAQIASYTVSYVGDTPHTAILLCDRDDGSRSLRACPDPSLALQLTLEEGCGRKIRFLGTDRAELL